MEFNNRIAPDRTHASLLLHIGFRTRLRASGHVGRIKKLMMYVLVNPRRSVYVGMTTTMYDIGHSRFFDSAFFVGVRAYDATRMISYDRVHEQ